MQDAHLITIPESEDDWESFIRSFEEEGENVYDYLDQELEEVKEVLLSVLPDEFHPYVLDGTINKPELDKKVREQLIAWQNKETEKYERCMEEAALYFEKIRDKLPQGLIDIYEAGLHDAVLKNVYRFNGNMRITLNSGGFSKGDVSVIRIFGIVEEKAPFPLEEAMYWLYEEVDIDEKGCRLGVLFDGSLEWEVIAKDFSIVHYYRDSDHFGWEDSDRPPVPEGIMEKAAKRICFSFPTSYLSLMNEKNGGTLTHSVFLLPSREVVIKNMLPVEEFENLEDFIPFAICDNGKVAFRKIDGKILFLGENGSLEEIAGDFSEFVENLFTEEYVEDSTDDIHPLPEEEIEGALFSADLSLNVQAWNTLYVKPEPFVDLIEKALYHYLQNEDPERIQLGEIFADHFLSLNLFTDDVAEKLQTLLNHD